MSGCYVLGQAAWMPGRPDVGAVIEGRTVPGCEAPDVRSHPSRLMRGTSTCTRMSAAVASRALAEAGVDPGTVPAVFASAFGELCIAVEQLEMMVTGDGRISPTLFKNSVHNTAAGVFSITHGNRVGSTTLAAGSLTVAHALLEAQGVLGEGAPFVLVVVGDEALPEPLSELARWESFAAAWVLGREPPVAGDRVRLSAIEPGAGPAAAVGPGLAAHPCRAAHALLAAIHRLEAGVVGLGQAHGEAWSVAVAIERRGGGS